MSTKRKYTLLITMDIHGFLICMEILIIKLLLTLMNFLKKLELTVNHSKELWSNISLD